MLVLFYGNLLTSRQRASSELVFSVSIVFAIVTFVVNHCYCTHGSFFGDVLINLQIIFVDNVKQDHFTFLCLDYVSLR